eukprot:TRINITY_DN27369_c0_g1_i1.p1 TRINITY_DN27369_c0_g1~~TRINITY_DN27369_c0_g1_i1.p1  ORF type:complete len:518 (+),score=207.59 TRINITY_DN27369_c0_g1_i1:131-1555(+)
MVKHARQTGETDTEMGAFDHLLDQPMELETLQTAVHFQIEWIDAFFFHKDPAERKKGASSASIIFTIWTTMCGSTMLTLPWAFNQAGFLMSLIVFFGGFFVSLYTCRMIYVQSQRMKETDYFKIVYRMSPVVEKVAQWTSTLVLVVALMSYHKYSTQSILGLSSSDSKYYSDFYVATGVALLQFSISFVKNLDPLFKMSTFSIVFVLFNMVFIIFKSGQVWYDPDKYCPAVDNTTAPSDNMSADWTWDVPSLMEVHTVDNFKLYRNTWPQFASVLCLSFFLHNLICPVLQTSGNPSKAGRDHILGYSGTAVCYILPGLSALFGYRHCQGDIQSNFLDTKMFPTDDYFAFVCRICVLFQNCMVYPLLVFICRSQVFDFFRDSPYLRHTKVNSAIVAGVLISLAAIPAAFKVQVGMVASFGGGICGLVWIYILPVTVHFWSKSVSGDKIGLGDIIAKVLILIYGTTTVILLFSVSA